MCVWGGEVLSVMCLLEQFDLRLFCFGRIYLKYLLFYYLYQRGVSYFTCLITFSDGSDHLLSDRSLRSSTLFSTKISKVEIQQ